VLRFMLFGPAETRTCLNFSTFLMIVPSPSWQKNVSK
jgi:hypothetical protein